MKKKYKVIILLVSLSVVFFFLGRIRWQGGSGPDEVFLDKSTCNFCDMHVSDIRFAGQIQTESETFFYDDVGCLINDKEKIKEGVSAVYFHHHLEDYWIPEGEVMFIKVTESPMGHNIGAIHKDDPESISPSHQRLSLDQARNHVIMNASSSHGRQKMKSEMKSEK